MAVGLPRASQSWEYHNRAVEDPRGTGKTGSWEGTNVEFVGGPCQKGKETMGNKGWGATEDGKGDNVP